MLDDDFWLIADRDAEAQGPVSPVAVFSRAQPGTFIKRPDPAGGVHCHAHVAADDAGRQLRHLLRSYGAGVRVNLFNFALLRWDYAIPLDGPWKGDGYWRFSIAPSF